MDNGYYLDLLFLQQEYIGTRGNDAVKSISDAKQQSNASQRRHPDPGGVQSKSDPVLRINNKI
jgi:hypothetical protein